MSSSNVYVDSFLTKKPKEGIQIVQTRLKDAMALDIEIAEYFRERAQIEEEYAKSLSKASKRLYTMDSMILGHFAPVWESLLKEFNQVAKYHLDMAYKITNEVEKPLRTSPSDDYEKLQKLEPMIHSIEKNNKLKGSILRKSKNSTNSWKNEGAEYLSLHQKIDEARLSRLKKSVQQFEEIQSQELINRVNMAKKNLSIADSFDVLHDIRDFCTERGRGLTTVNTTAATPTTATATNNIARERSFTSNISNESHRSPNKFKSLFMKKKKSFDQEDHQSTHYAEMNDSDAPRQPVVDSYSPSQNNAPLVDAEGYSIPSSNFNINTYPNTASDISSRNTSDDVDSDFQSLKTNQKLKINIKDDVVQEETTEATESFNKMATMLRERTPTTTRKARGRRESAILRSQTDPNVFGNTLSNNNRSHSMMLSSSPSSLEFSRTNPFMNSPEKLPFTGIQLSDPPVHLQSIPEVQPSKPSGQHLTVSIVEKTSMQSPTVLHVKGEIYIHYHGTPTLEFVPLCLNHVEGIQQFTVNSEYITSNISGTYELNTARSIDNPVMCFTYEFNTSALALPIRLAPSWKCVEGVTYLMVKHEKNPISSALLKGWVRVAMHDQHVNQVQSTPQGVWDIDKQELTWNLQDLLNQYTAQEQLRLLAKFYVEGQGTPQPVYLNYSVKDNLVSGTTVTSDAVDIKHIETMVQSDQIVYL